MPRRPHDPRDCDEACRSCTTCYVRHGRDVCDWQCAHTAEQHADEIEEAEMQEDGFYCDCETCQMERAASEAEEPRR